MSNPSLPNPRFRLEVCGMKTLISWIMALSPLMAEGPASKTEGPAAKVKVEHTSQPEGHKVTLDKVVFEARVVSLGHILERKNDRISSATFLVISAEAKENLGVRLLWADVEVEMSDGSKLKFERFNFHGLSQGIEGDVRRLNDADAQVAGGVDSKKPLELPGENSSKVSGKPVEVRKLRVSNLQFK